MSQDVIINVNKPQNMTSHDVVAIMRRALGIKKIGHTGTLDPMATGVLPLCINRSTKIIQYLETDMKTYLCTMKLGVKTDTDDIWGTIIEEKNFDFITEMDILNVSKKFIGKIIQIPPIYSALKVNGKRLYEYARNGENVEIKEREIFIEEFDVKKIEIESGTISFRVKCSKGTYIRSICRDLASSLGTNGTMIALERVQSGEFSIDDAIDVDYIKVAKKEEILARGIDIQKPLSNFGEINLGNIETSKFLRGMKISARDFSIDREPKYKKNKFPLPIDEIFTCGYNVFGQVNEERTYLGVGRIIKDTGSLKVEKMIYIG